MCGEPSAPDQGLPGRALDHPGKPTVVNGEPRSLTKTKGRRLALTLRAAQRPQLIAEQRVRAGRPVLDPPDVTQHAIEVYLVPAQVTQLGGTQALPEGDQDHGSVPMAVSIGLGSLDQRLDFATRVS
jgi:hypothetical protein